MRRLLILLVLFVFSNVYIHSQNYFLPSDTSFLQVMNRNASLLPDTTSDSEYIKFQRFASFWNQRLYPDYDLSKVNNAYKTFYQGFNSNPLVSLTASSSDWTCLGPDYITTGGKPTIGRLDHVEIDSDDPTGKTIYVSSIGGGVFRTTDGGLNWSNYFTDYAFGTTQVTDMRLAKDLATSKKYLFVAVGGDNIPFNGIYRNEIGTGVWQNLTGNLDCSGLFQFKVNNIVNKILIDPTNINNIYLATTKGVFYTCLNYGCTILPCSPGTVTWQKESNINGNILGICFDYSDPTYKSIYCSGGNIWHTSNIASGFNIISSTNSSFANAFDNHTNFPPVATFDLPINNIGVSVSSNNGSSLINIDTDPSQPNYLYIIFKMYGSSPVEKWNSNVLIYDNTSTATFPNNFIGLEGLTNLSAQMDDDKLNILKLTSSNRLAFSSSPTYGLLSFYDIPSSWVMFVPEIQFDTKHHDVHDFVFFNNDLYITNDGGLVKADPFGSVQSLNGKGLVVEKLYGSSTNRKNDNAAVIGLQDDGSWETSTLYSANATWSNIMWSDGSTPLFTNSGNFFKGETYFWNLYYPNLAHNIGQHCSNYMEKWDRPYKSIDGNENIYYGGHELYYNYNPVNSTSTVWDNNIMNCTSTSSPLNKGWAQISTFESDLSMSPNSCLNAFVADFDVSPDEKTIYVCYFNNSVGSCSTQDINNFWVLWRTTNGGFSDPNRTTTCSASCWDPLGTLSELGLTGAASAVCMNPSNPNEVWVGASGYTGGNPSLSHVIHSTDGGTTWSDFSNGLPDMPVNKLLFRKGTDYEIYAATDVGVYYIKKPMTSWQRLGTTLPNVPVLNLEINDCSEKLYASTFGRGLWVFNLPPITNHAPITKTLSSNTTWNSTQYVFGDVVVPSGITLSVLGTNVYLGKGSSIIVEPGGKLDLQNCVLQGYCDNAMWNGIQVAGNPAQFPIYNSVLQRYMNQGYAYIKNSTIKDAEVAAVSLVKHNFNITGNIVWGTMGGQVYAENSSFINNYRDFEFYDYPFANKSVITGCTLQVNNQLKNPLITPDARIAAFNVVGVQVEGTLFSNTAPTSANSGIRGTGISAINGFFTIKDKSGLRTRFENLDYGVTASATSSSLYSFKIDKTDFSNCARGTYIKSIDFASVTNCNYFTIPTGSLFSNLPYNQNSCYGLYFDYSSNFVCESNAFFSARSTSKNNIGCIVGNSRFNANRIYNCDFTNLSLGSGAYDDNYDATNTVGLKLNCNKYSGNVYDIAILSSIANNPNTDIDPVQSYWTSFNAFDLSKLIRNLYSANCAGNENEYFSDKLSSTQIQHYHHSTESANGGTFNTAPPVLSCKDNLINTISVSGNFKRDNITCPPTVATTTGCPTCLIVLNNQITSSISELTLEQAPLLAGAASSLIVAINSTISPSSLKTLLLDLSPYLSDEVLIKYVQSTPPPGIEKQILIANSPLTDPVLSVVNSAGLPSGVYSDVMAAQTGTNKRTIKEGLVNFILSDVQNLYSDKVRYFMADTSDTRNDSIRSAIYNPYFSDREIKLLDFYILGGKYDEAAKQIIYLKQNFSELRSYCDFKSLQIDLLKSDKGLLTLQTDLAKKEEIIKIALDSRNLGSAQAQNILQLAIGDKTNEYTLFPPDLSSESRFSQNNQNEEQKDVLQKSNLNDHNLVAIPNPAKNELSIKYKLPKTESNGIITLTDLTGRVIFKYDVISTGETINVDANSLNNGIYLYCLQVKGTVIETKKLTIVK